MPNLSEYLSGSIENVLFTAYKASLFSFREFIFLKNYIRFNKEAVKQRHAYEMRGINIPPFLIASISSNCNLFCSGCYARANKSCGQNPTINQLSSTRWNEIFTEAGSLGINFILLAGGEPLMKRDVIEAAALRKNIIFPIFTNGTMIDSGYINLFNRNRNLIPVISMEGDEQQTDSRRGPGVYKAIDGAMNNLKRKRIFYGVSVTVTKNNISYVTSSEFVDRLKRNGCKIVFYVEYVPVDNSTVELTLDGSDRYMLEQRVKTLQREFTKMIFIDFPGDEKYLGGCLAAGRGFFHINAGGSAEPCPFSPYSDMNLKDHSILEALSSPLFRKIRESGMLLDEHIGGCLLFQEQQKIKEMLNEEIITLQSINVLN
ncbi:MAG: radical SAM protein [Bacillota bacterium]|nr:radical SAM protein [Bacillota bacterium]